MIVYVDKIHCPAWSDVAYGWGLNGLGEYIWFVGDRNPMRRVQEVLKAKRLPIAASVEDWQILSW
jgi:hypothetical protein